MNLLLICCALLPCACAFAVAAESGAADSAACPALRDAVILIIRHAEKPASGPGLSPEGQQRAEAYVQYFQHFTVDGQPLKLARLFATADSAGSQRPRLTLGPLSKALGLEIDHRFGTKKPVLLVDELRSRDHGKSILVCWHHGEIPEVLRALGADPATLLPNGEWPADAFGWMLELRFDHDGRLNPDKTRRINEHLRPGDRD